MDVYVRVLNGVVAEPRLTTSGPAPQCHPELGEWLKATGLAPPPDQGWTYDGTHFVAPTPPAPPVQTPAQRLAAFVASGFALTSTSAPALDGTYAVTSDALIKIASIYAGIKGGDGLPGGGATFNYRDASGQPHAFDADHFTAFAKLIRDFDYAVETAAAEIADGGSPSLPPASGTIS